MKKLILIVGMMAFLSEGMMAQQEAAYSMYMFNGLYLNPAYAGSKESLSLTALYRHQWVNIPGAPRSVSVSAHTPFKKNQYALGLILTNDRLGANQSNSVYASFAYRIDIGEETKLSLGLQSGFSHYHADLTSLELYDDNGQDVRFETDESIFMPNFGFGIYLYSKKYYLGFAVPHLINNKLARLSEAVTGSTDIARQYKHYVARLGYVFGKDHSKIKFKPSVNFRYVKGAPVDFDFNTSLLFIDRFWVGASYRTGGDEESYGESVIGMFEFMATAQIRIGYSYDYTLSGLRQVNSGTHEFMIGYDFNFSKEKFVNPRYISYF